MEDYSNIGKEGSMSGSHGGSKMKDMSPEEVRRKAKENAARSTAAASGAIEGYVQNADPKVVGEATRTAAETVRNTVDSVKQEVSQGLPGEPVFNKGSSSSSMSMESSGPGMKEKIGSRASEIGSTVRERASHAGQNVKGQISNAGQKARENMRSTAEELRNKSPDEARAMMRDAVGRPVAGMTGALEGYTEQADPNLPSQAVKKVGETVREAGGAVREEVQKGKSGGKSSTYIESETTTIIGTSQPLDDRNQGL